MGRDPKDRQVREKRRWRKNGGQVELELEAKMTNEDRARFPHLLVAFPSNEPAMDKKGRDQTGVDDQASGVRRCALADVLPSDADSVAGKC